MDKNLKTYNKKRNFDKTKEPIGKKTTSKKRLHFVVQHHLARADHYDFRLEWDGVLLSWAVPKGPSLNPSDKRLAAHVEDHPFSYRNFEGNIPKGEYGGGVVMLWDEGHYEPNDDFAMGLKNGSLKFTLFGERLQGSWALVKMKHATKSADNWLLIKHQDEYAKKTAGISKYTTSIRSNRTMKQIENNLVKKTENPFKKVDVQLAKLESSIPKGDEWIHEIKFDGYRILAFIENNEVKLLTRNNLNYTAEFLEIASSLTELAAGQSMVMDGEVVIIDKNGKSDFQALQRYLKKSTEDSLSYIAFDLLALDGVDLRKEPLIKRKEKLKKIIEKNAQNIFYSAHAKGNGQKHFDEVSDKGLEGIISKKENSKYSGTRNGDWIKVKCENRQEFIIVGYINSKKVRGAIQCLLLGYYRDNRLIYAGRVGSGFNQSIMNDLINKLEKSRRKTSSLDNIDDLKGIKDINWVKPLHIAEIKFTEWTSDGHLRHPSFKGLRIDKKTREVINESFPAKKQKKRTLAISSPDKILFSEDNITKQQVADYYMSVSKRMLPYLKHRLLSLISCPGGINSSCFFKKHPVNEENIYKIKVKNSKNANNEYFYLETTDGIISQVQMNSLEFHIWGSSIETLEKPDMLVFDLDPDENLSLKDVRQGAKDLKQVLNKLNLISFIKTSGGKGYHIVVPLKPAGDWDKVKTFAKNVAMYMEQNWPEKYTANVRKEKRHGRIFIDWLRNTKGATSVAPYSIRARPGAPVSYPISWNSLNKIAPNEIKMQDAIKRLKNKDPWQDFFKVSKTQFID